MRYSIEQEDDEIIVTIEDADGHERALLDAVRNCPQAAQHGCAVECGKIASFEQYGLGDAVVMRLVPRSGEQLEMSAVRSCLNILWKASQQ